MKKNLIISITICWILVIIAGCNDRVYRQELRTDAAQDNAYAAQQNALAQQAIAEAKQAEIIAAQHQADAERYAAQQQADAQRHAAQLAADAQRYAAEQTSIARQAEAAAQSYAAQQSAAKWSQLTDGFQSFLFIIPFVIVLLIGGFIIVRMMDNHSRLALAVVENHQQPPTINITIPESVQQGMIQRGGNNAVPTQDGKWLILRGREVLGRMVLSE